MGLFTRARETAATMTTDPAPTPPQSPPKLAGEQVADNTRNVGAALLAVGYVVGIGKEYGIDLLAWLDPRWVQFLSDPRVVGTITTAVLYGGNMYRKSRLKRRIDRLLGDQPPQTSDDATRELQRLRQELEDVRARTQVSQGRP